MIRLLRKHKDLVAWLTAFALMISFIYAYNPGRKTVLKLGVYAGSSWDVPSNDTKVLDRVI
ncbi:MAG TPA: sugar-binding protein, partial [Erysipelotrichaceae bacterium]|nr:sugar-binding protein [Erysipelotrichaceae bacterium]